MKNPILMTLWIAASFALAACSPQSGSGDAAASEAQPVNTTEESAPSLNLSRDLISDGEVEEELADAENVLPDMFAEEADQPKTRISGKVLTKEEAQTLTDSVDGVELKIEVPTGS